jgi:hypothetical protein
MRRQTWVNDGFVIENSANTAWMARVIKSVNVKSVANIISTGACVWREGDGFETLTRRLNYVTIFDAKDKHVKT